MLVITFDTPETHLEFESGSEQEVNLFIDPPPKNKFHIVFSVKDALCSFQDGKKTVEFFPVTPKEKNDGSSYTFKVTVNKSTDNTIPTIIYVTAISSNDTGDAHIKAIVY